jgi:hypothetical protein
MVIDDWSCDAKLAAHRRRTRSSVEEFIMGTISKHRSTQTLKHSSNHHDWSPETGCHLLINTI